MVLEKFYFFIKKHPEIIDVEILEHYFLYTAYVDYTFFLKDAQSIENLAEISKTFLFLRLKPNLTKCKIAGIRALKAWKVSTEVAVCGMRRIVLCKKATTILDTCFSYNSRIKEDCNFGKIVSNVQSVLKLSQFRNLTLVGRIVVFKSLAI